MLSSSITQRKSVNETTRPVRKLTPHLLNVSFASPGTRNVSLDESESQLEEGKRGGGSACSQRKAWITRGTWPGTQVLCLDPFPDRNFIA